MICSNSENCPQAAQSLIRQELCAQLAPLDRYGLDGLSSAVATGLRTLAELSLNVFSRSERAHEN